MYTYKQFALCNQIRQQNIIKTKMSLFNLFKKQEEQTNKSKSKSIKESSFYSQSDPTLPENFAQTVMELQMQLEFVETYDMEVVHKLNEMYRIAIEHYINEDPRKANHFQRKLTSLLTNPHTLEIIENNEKAKNNFVKEPTVNTTHYNTQLKQELNKFNSQSEILVKSIIEGSQKKVERSHKMIASNLTSQQDILQRRLIARSKSRSRHKTQTPQSPTKNQLPKS